MKGIWKAFSEGFLGSFALAGAIVLAVAAVARSFITGHPKQTDPPLSRL